MMWIYRWRVPGHHRNDVIVNQMRENRFDKLYYSAQNACNLMVMTMVVLGSERLSCLYKTKVKYFNGGFGLSNCLIPCLSPFTTVLLLQSSPLIQAQQKVPPFFIFYFLLLLSRPNDDGDYYYFEARMMMWWWWCRQWRLHTCHVSDCSPIIFTIHEICRNSLTHAIAQNIYSIGKASAFEKRFVSHSVLGKICTSVEWFTEWVYD